MTDVRPMSQGVDLFTIRALYLLVEWPGIGLASKLASPDVVVCSGRGHIALQCIPFPDGSGEE